MNQIILSNALLSENTPNLLIHGSNGYDKFFSIFEKCYKITDKTKIIKKEINYFKTNIYYEFNVQTTNQKNFKYLIESINEIVNYKDYFTTQNHKIIILNHFNKIKNNIQNIFRIIIEKYRSTTLFILITDKYNNIIEPLRSRCLPIRFPQLKNKEKRKIIYKNLNPNKITRKYYDFIYTLSDKNEIDLALEVKDIVEKDYIDPYNLVTREIINIYKKQYTKTSYKSLKDISYNIIKFNLDIPNFYKVFLSEILKGQKIRDKQKYELIKLFAESEYNYNKSYRSIIILESLLFHVYKYYLL